MAKLNVSQAARATGKNRTTLYRHIKSGRLSVEKDATDNPVIDVSELQRVYGSINMDATDETDATATDKPLQQQPDTGQSNTELQLLKLQLEHLEKERDTERERRQEAEARERSSKEEVQRLLGIVESQTKQLAAPASAEPERRRKFLGIF